MMTCFMSRIGTSTAQYFTLAALRRGIASAAVPLALAAAPAASAADFESAYLQSYFQVSPLAPQTYDAPYGAGAHAGSHYDYNITCSGGSCAGLPFGGNLGDVTFSFDLSDNGVLWDMSAFQGSDSGDESLYDWYLEVFYSSTQPFRFVTSDVRSLSTIDCGDCQRSIQADTDTYFDGSLWRGSVVLYGNASISMGRQSLSQIFSATISAVPEPASWALMLLGFATIGSAMRRRPMQPAPA